MIIIGSTISAIVFMREPMIGIVCSVGFAVLTAKVFTILSDFEAKKRNISFKETGDLDYLEVDDIMDDETIELLSNPTKLSKVQKKYKESKLENMKRKKRTKNLNNLGI